MDYSNLKFDEIEEMDVSPLNPIKSDDEVENLSLLDINPQRETEQSFDEDLANTYAGLVYKVIFLLSNM